MTAFRWLIQFSLGRPHLSAYEASGHRRFPFATDIRGEISLKTRSGFPSYFVRRPIRRPCLYRTPPKSVYVTLYFGTTPRSDWDFQIRTSSSKAVSSCTILKLKRVTARVVRLGAASHTALAPQSSPLPFVLTFGERSKNQKTVRCTSYSFFFSIFTFLVNNINTSVCNVYYFDEYVCTNIVTNAVLRV